MINYFQLLNLPESFSLELKDIEDNYFQLQRKYHPDQAKNEDKSKYLQISTNLNKAYKTLRCLCTRAEHILNLQGIDVTASNFRSIISTDFLKNIFLLQNKLHNISTAAELRKLKEVLNTSFNNSIKDLEFAFNSKDYETAIIKTIELKYWDNLINFSRLYNASN
ncbi:fe-S protein assembly co-chaperone HscB [Orientia chuto str. Dubai]|uniref:Fe-S protein assembly co-chaperone HscB n=1 Tax=Orientia chuto str. Dubai TaxID=1359168 RepID=A0A0F3MNE3_9RICK|nr:Fe-S protein assembly co-chaperone HscB [Candidatus Orientia mediorientalis]KJV57293.1 fe-S protein assembly co-chaperone HscB [Orientia chuto str. Dubai]